MARLILFAPFLGLYACATGAQEGHASLEQLERVERRANELDARNREQADQISMLRAQVALAQAEARDARLRSEQRRDVVRIGAAPAEVASAARADEPAWIDDEGPAGLDPADEPPTPPRVGDDAARPVLRLHGARTMPLTGSSAVRESLPPGPVDPPSVSTLVGAAPGPAVTSFPSPSAQAQPAPAVLGRASPTDASLARETYRVALSHVTGRRFDQAIIALTAFTERFPGHPYVDNAIYWRGTSHYALRRYREALADFERVVAEYPSGNKVPDALLQIGMCHRRLGDAGRARAYFERVRREHPRSVAARLAAREDTT